MAVDERSDRRVSFALLTCLSNSQVTTTETTAGGRWRSEWDTYQWTLRKGDIGFGRSSSGVVPQSPWFAHHEAFPRSRCPGRVPDWIRWHGAIRGGPAARGGGDPRDPCRVRRRCDVDRHIERVWIARRRDRAQRTPYCEGTFEMGR